MLKFCCDHVSHTFICTHMIHDGKTLSMFMDYDANKSVWSRKESMLFIYRYKWMS